MMSNNLFAYGSLMIDEVFEIVLGRFRPSMSARLDGFTRFTLIGHDFPAIIPCEGCHVEGTIFLELSEIEFSCLDKFELEAYERRRVSVKANDGLSYAADTYILRERFRELLSNRRWDLQAFKVKHLSSYLATCRDWKKSTSCV